VKQRLACIHCGKQLRPDRACCKSCNKAILRRIAGRFELLQALAVKENTISYLAVDHAEHVPAFLRVLRPGASASEKSRMVGEAELLRQLDGSAPFPRFITAGWVHAVNTVYTAQELVEGISLEEVARRARPSEIVDLVLQALDVVGVLHRNGWVHCDLKARHFILNDRGEVRLTDLRCARTSGSASHGLGPASCRAPEQYAKTAEVTPATDVFALGAMLYALLTGRSPYPAAGKEPASFPRQIPLPPSSLNPHVTGDVDEIVMRTMAFRPEDRFRDASAMRSALWGRFAGRTQVDVDERALARRPARLWGLRWLWD
jgi:serine/threonine protein kinase